MLTIVRPLAPLLLLVASHSPSYAVEPRNIGTAVEITNNVTAALENADKRRLAKQDPVREREILESARNSRGEFILADDTKLVLGPTARLVLDEFVYDPNQSSANNRVNINLVKGAFRFISGGSGQNAYRITTPLATLGIRGTKIDGYIADNGRMALLLQRDPGRSTEVEVCSNVQPQNCELLNASCHVLYVTPTGTVMPQQANWDGNMLPDVGLRTAFPFLERRLTVDPVIGCRYADLFTPPPVLRRAMAPAPMPEPPAPPPAPEPIPYAQIAATVAVPLGLGAIILNVSDDDDDIFIPISP